MRSLVEILSDLRDAKRTFIRDVWPGEQVEELVPHFSAWWEAQRAT